MAAASTARHETRALLRAHLAAASGYRHLTGACAVCHRLLALAIEAREPAYTAEGEPDAESGADAADPEPDGPPTASGAGAESVAPAGREADERTHGV
ncbi:DUF6274 family protein [Streptomyces sp. ODS05-4]|uniref:DUF6274 family protein n=1 Tax=Streptomyces sp. ODS05-4 TaxID=2944939 RepID=UPI002109555A|nr:DUF6274 family protein [Streptomyces sp. ODS05-4]